MNKVLVLVPRVRLLGGVANYYYSLRPYLPDNIQYFVRGSRGYKKKLVRILILIYDIIRFSAILGFSKIRLVVINTSIGNDGLKRDAVFFRIAKNIFKKKVIVFFRGWESLFFQKSNLPGWFAKTYFQSDKIIVLSNEFKKQLISVGYSGTIIVETTTVDNELLTDNNCIPTAVSSFSLLFLSRVEKDKGIYDVLDTVKLLQDGGYYISLDVAGEGSELPAVKKFADSKNIKNINFHGHVRGKAKAGLFRASSVYLFPSYHGEGMPNSVLEAMAFGLPVLTTRVGGIVDFFVEGEMGFFVDNKNVESLYNQLLKLIISPDLCKKISSYNIEYARNNFYSDKVAARLISYFD